MKKAISILLVILLLSLTACDSASGQTDPTAATTDSAEATTVPTETVPEPPKQLLKEVIFDGTDHITGVYQYDEAGRVIRIDRTYDYNGNLYDYEIFQYDADGKLLSEEKWYSDDIPEYHFTYEYDENGVLVRSNDEKAHDAVWSWYAYKYDENGRLTQCTVYDQVGKYKITKGKNLFTYNEQGLLIREEHYNKEKTQLYLSVDYTYNDQNLLIQKEEISYNSTFNKTVVETYDYNSHGQILRCNHWTYSEGVLFSYLETTYFYG